LVVGRQKEELSVCQKILALMIDQQGLRSDGPMFDIIMVQKIQSSNNVIDHSEDLYLLEVVINHLPLLGG
jgi:hypothetical protein